MKLQWKRKMYAQKLNIMKKSIHINCLMEMLCDGELNFFYLWNRERDERERQR